MVLSALLSSLSSLTPTLPIREGDTISFRYKEFEPDGEDYFSGSWEHYQGEAPVISRNGILGVEVIFYGTGMGAEFVALEQLKDLKIVSTTVRCFCGKREAQFMPEEMKYIRTGSIRCENCHL